jgi:hypothetical protein
MASKLADEDLAALTAEFARGGLHGELAVEFGITERHVRRLCANVEGHPPTVEGSVTWAVEQFLDGIELGGRTDSVIAETTRLVAARLDRADGTTTPRWRGSGSTWCNNWRCGIGSLARLTSCGRGTGRAV